MIVKVLGVIVLAWLAVLFFGLLCLMTKVIWQALRNR